MLNDNAGRLSDSKGVWVCENPLEHMSFEKMDGMVSEDDIYWLSFDSEKGFLYGASLRKGLWRYEAE